MLHSLTLKSFTFPYPITLKVLHSLNSQSVTFLDSQKFYISLPYNSQSVTFPQLSKWKFGFKPFFHQVAIGGSEYGPCSLHMWFFPTSKLQCVIKLFEPLNCQKCILKSAKPTRKSSHTEARVSSCKSSADKAWASTSAGLGFRISKLYKLVWKN